MPSKSQNMYVSTPGWKRTSSSSNPNSSFTKADWSHSWVNSRIDDGPVTGFRWKLANAWDATSNLTGTRREYTCDPGEFYLRQERLPSVSPFLDSWIVHQHTGDFGQPIMPTVGSASLTEADTEAIMKFVKRAREAYTALQGGIVLGEIREAIKMIRYPGAKLRAGIDQYGGFLMGYRGRIRNSDRNFLANTWLEYSFGWKPLISDIEAGALALEQMSNRLFDHRSIGAKGNSKTSAPTAVIGKSMEGGHTIQGDELQFGEFIVIYRGAVKLPIGNRALMTRQNLGFTWGNFVPTVWELIPYSFLIDYFTNIGEVLSAWSAWDLNISWMNKTVIDRRVRKITMSRMTNLNYNPLWYKLVTNRLKPSVSTTEVRTVSRSRYTGSLIPTFRFELPEVGSLKWLNLAALASSRFRLTPL